MTITVRTRKPKNGLYPIYLDIYNPKAKKARTSKNLNLFAYAPILSDRAKKEDAVAAKAILKKLSRTKKDSHKESLEAADRIRSKMVIDSAYEQNDLSELKQHDKSNIFFLDYFLEQTEKRFESMNNYGNWDSVHKHLLKFCPNDVPINQVDPKWLENFKFFLQHTARTKSEKKLSQNSLHSYFNKVKACLKQAHREELILKNPSERVKGFKMGETKREYLTFEELQAASNAECDIPQLKKAFIFSCLTGVRWSDINNLLWNDLQYSEASDRWFLRFRQQKTKGVETHPISLQAKEMLGEIGESEERIFKGLKYSAWHNVKLQQWMMRAKISKTITFHCGRHTYATLQLTNGTDIYTVSKLLGHRELKTTQVYAKIIDQVKEDASDAIPKLDL